MTEAIDDASARLRRAEARLRDVEATLGRLEDGSYGRCRSCGQPIPDDLLASDPTAGTCATCRPPTVPAQAWAPAASTRAGAGGDAATAQEAS